MDSRMARARFLVQQHVPQVFGFDGPGSNPACIALATDPRGQVLTVDSQFTDCGD
jgi:hypothetical protein